MQRRGDRSVGTRRRENFACYNIRIASLTHHAQSTALRRNYDRKPSRNSFHALADMMIEAAEGEEAIRGLVNNIATELTVVVV